MPRPLSFILILGLFAPSLGFASIFPETPNKFLLTYSFTAEQEEYLLTISPLTEYIFIWSLWQLPNSNYANPHAATSIGSLNLSYNPNGDLTDRSDGVSHEWDYNNRLTKITIPAISPNPGKILTYTYDPSGIRLTSTTKDLNTLQTSTTTYPSIYYNTDGSKVIEHVFANDVLILTLETTGATTQSFWNFQDHLNSTVLVSDISGGLFERVEYYAFGSILRNPGPHKEQRKYTGHEYDPQTPTNYTYAKARYLDTKFGRFLSEEPLVWDEPEGLLEDPQLMNSYAYARNNPVKFVDPDGKLLQDASRPVARLWSHSYIYARPQDTSLINYAALGIPQDTPEFTIGFYNPGTGYLVSEIYYPGMKGGSDGAREDFEGHASRSPERVHTYQGLTAKEEARAINVIGEAAADFNDKSVKYPKTGYGINSNSGNNTLTGIAGLPKVTHSGITPGSNLFLPSNSFGNARIQKLVQVATQIQALQQQVAQLQDQLFRLQFGNSQSTANYIYP